MCEFSCECLIIQNEWGTTYISTFYKHIARFLWMPLTINPKVTCGAWNAVGEETLSHLQNHKEAHLGIKQFKHKLYPKLNPRTSTTYL